MNKGNVLAQMEQWQETADCYSEGIGIWGQLVAAGQTHFMPNLLKALGIRFDLSRRFAMWVEGAGDVVAALNYALPLLQVDAPPETLVREFVAFLQRLRDLSSEEKNSLYGVLGAEWTGFIRPLLEGDGVADNEPNA